MEQALAVFEPETDLPAICDDVAPRRYFWSTRELGILDENFSSQGLDACVALLPGRSRMAIYQRARSRGLDSKSVPVVTRTKWETTAQIDAIITRTYQTAPTKGSVSLCAKAVNRPRWWVTRRASVLGLTIPRFKEPDWSEEEDDIICSNANKRSSTIRKALAKQGFSRTETAIDVRLKRIGQSRRDDPNNYSANELGKLLGVSVHPVLRWINSGWLRARKKKAENGQNDTYRIHRRDVRQFIVENANVIDLRKVDRTWFIDLLGERDEAAVSKRVERQGGPNATG